MYTIEFVVNASSWLGVFITSVGGVVDGAANGDGNADDDDGNCDDCAPDESINCREAKRGDVDGSDAAAAVTVTVDLIGRDFNDVDNRKKVSLLGLLLVPSRFRCASSIFFS